MLKQFYLQIDEVSRITDVIEFPHEDYLPVELSTPLPPQILGGAYKLVGDSAVYIPAWDSSLLSEHDAMLLDLNFRTLLLEQNAAANGGATV